jgi:PAS domain S-box-containing protein
MSEWIIVFSVFVQVFAAIVALRLFRETKGREGWLFVALAIFLMVLRRFFGLVRITGSDVSTESVILLEETAGFATSCLLFVGLLRLGSLFKLVQESGERIMASEKKYRAVFQGASDAILIVNKDGTVIDCNESAEKLLGFPAEAIKGSNLSILSAPDQGGIWQAFSLNNWEAVDWILVGADGKKIETELKASRILINGEEGLLCVFRDRTEEKRAQRELSRSYEYLELIVDRNPMPTFVLDEYGSVTLWNLACERLTGIPREEVLGSKPNFQVLYPNRKIPPTLAELLLTFDPSFLVKKLEVRGVSLYPSMPDTVTCETAFETRGSEKRVKLIASRLYDRDGRLIGAIQIAQDVTMERALERYASQAQRMESLGRLASGIAHDFRNILMVIQSSMELLKHNLRDNPNVARFGRDVGVAVEQGVSLCRQLMAFAKEREEEQLPPQMISVNSVIRGLEKFLRRVFREDIHVQIDLDPNIGNIRAYPGQVDRVLTNLFLNAQDAMLSGGTLWVRTQEVLVSKDEIPPSAENVKPGRFVMITVKDTGVGMDEETMKRIFEPFFSSKGSTGHGLGLYVVWNEIQNLGGFIRVESSPSLGTAFHCYIPLWEEEEGVGVKPEEARREVKPVLPKRVLLVEDNLALKDVMTQMLRTMGHTVSSAGSIREALHELSKIGDSLDLALCDIRLPDGDGYGLVQEIQSRFPHVTCILMTGYADKNILNKCHTEGLPVLYKPFSMSTVEEIFATLEESSIIRSDTVYDVPKSKQNNEGGH